MKHDAHIADLKHRREELIALLEPLESGALVSGDAEATKALIISRRRELEEADALIAKLEAEG